MGAFILNQLEEEFETWDYLITDKFVYALESVGRKEVIEGGYLERYLHSDLRVACLVRCFDVYYFIIAEALAQTVNDIPITELEDEMRVTGDDFPVFINSIDFVKPPKGFHLRPIPTVVRLKAFNNGTSVGRYISQFTFNPIVWVVEFGKAIKDGEFSTSVGTLRREQCQLPREIIKSRTKVMSNFRNNIRPCRGRLPFDYEPKSIFSGRLSVVLSDNCEWLGTGCKKQFGFPIEIVESFLCPDDFELNVIKRGRSHPPPRIRRK